MSDLVAAVKVIGPGEQGVTVAQTEEARFHLVQHGSGNGILRLVVLKVIP